MAKERNEVQQDSRKQYSDKTRQTGPQFKVRYEVLVNVHALIRAKSGFASKFAPRRDDPYRPPTSFQVATDGDPFFPLGASYTSPSSEKKMTAQETGAAE
ncbi:hypothetical protein J437_LFUL014417 [Ladona fulva]|uniref:Uncharacterized protein n=1 Tax=Ladona fulva TaxID=123851 RepID=A0A8K0K4H4_LADFU|nr:hypothetical protein J437_LFUL014417 [Ladona fulva]